MLRTQRSRHDPHNLDMKHETGIPIEVYLHAPTLSTVDGPVNGCR